MRHKKQRRVKTYFGYCVDNVFISENKTFDMYPTCNLPVGYYNLYYSKIASAWFATIQRLNENHLNE
jgi:hypothetical protein